MAGQFQRYIYYILHLEPRGLQQEATCIAFTIQTGLKALPLSSSLPSLSISLSL